MRRGFPRRERGSRYRVILTYPDIWESHRLVQMQVQRLTPVAHATAAGPASHRLCRDLAVQPNGRQTSASSRERSLSPLHGSVPPRRSPAPNNRRRRSPSLYEPPKRRSVSEEAKVRKAERARILRKLRKQLKYAEEMKDEGVQLGEDNMMAEYDRKIQEARDRLHYYLAAGKEMITAKDWKKADYSERVKAEIIHQKRYLQSLEEELEEEEEETDLRPLCDGCKQEPPDYDNN